MLPEPAMATQAIRVLVADSSRINTQLMSDALKRDPGLKVIPWASDCDGLIATARAENVDVLAVSCAMNGHPVRGLELMRELLADRPSTRAVVLLDSRDRESVVEAFRAGARGVFSRDGSVDTFRLCIYRVHQGQVWANTREMGFLLEALSASPKISAVNAKGLSLLSKREADVVRCLVQGLTNREIAEQLKISQHTVKNYLFRVFDKLGVSNRIELLFMTLNEPGQRPSLTQHEPAITAVEASREEFTVLQKAADAGVRAAQLALAQFYLSRRAGPQDLVDAYMWYLVATEGASQAGGLISNMLPPPQIEEAQNEASSWLARLKRTALAMAKDQTESLPDLSQDAGGPTHE